MQDLTTTLSRGPHPDDNVHQTRPTVLERFPAGGPRGSWPAEEFAQARRLEGIDVDVVMNLNADAFFVIAKAVNV